MPSDTTVLFRRGSSLFKPFYSRHWMKCWGKQSRVGYYFFHIYSIRLSQELQGHPSMTAYGHSSLYCSSPAFLIARKKKELLKDLRKVQSTRGEHEYDVNAPNDHVPLQWGNLSQACWVLKFFSFFCKITISYEHLLVFIEVSL